MRRRKGRGGEENGGGKRKKEEGKEKEAESREEKMPGRGEEGKEGPRGQGFRHRFGQFVFGLDLSLTSTLRLFASIFQPS